MACSDRYDFLRAIDPCRGSQVTKGAASCPQLLDATLAHGAGCLALPMYANGPPFGYSVCPGEGKMVALCEQAGFKGPARRVRADTGPRPGPGMGTLTKLGYGTAGVATLAAVYTGVGAAMYYGPEDKPTRQIQLVEKGAFSVLPRRPSVPEAQSFGEFLKIGLRRNKIYEREYTPSYGA